MKLPRYNDVLTNITDGTEHGTNGFLWPPRRAGAETISLGGMIHSLDPDGWRVRIRVRH